MQMFLSRFGLLLLPFWVFSMIIHQWQHCLFLWSILVVSWIVVEWWSIHLVIVALYIAFLGSLFHSCCQWTIILASVLLWVGVSNVWVIPLMWVILSPLSYNSIVAMWVCVSNILLVVRLVFHHQLFWFVVLGILLLPCRLRQCEDNIDHLLGVILVVYCD